MQTIGQGANAENSVIRFFQYAVMALALAMAMGLFATTAMAEKVNLNQANAETLEYIPGIGASKSAAIISLREQNGGFKSFEDLLEVRGIGVKILEDIRLYGTLIGGVAEVSQAMRDNPPQKKARITATNVVSEQSATDQSDGAAPVDSRSMTRY